MKNVIYKHQLEIIHIQKIQMPTGSRIISAKEQNGVLTIWSLQDMDEPLRHKSIQVIGTGNPIQYNVSYHDWHFVGTVLMPNGLVWHVFSDLL